MRTRARSTHFNDTRRNISRAEIKHFNTNERKRREYVIECVHSDANKSITKKN